MLGDWAGRACNAVRFPGSAGEREDFEVALIQAIGVFISEDDNEMQTNRYTQLAAAYLPSRLRLKQSCGRYERDRSKHKTKP